MVKETLDIWQLIFTPIFGRSVLVSRWYLYISFYETMQVIIIIC